MENTTEFVQFLFAAVFWAGIIVFLIWRHIRLKNKQMECAVAKRALKEALKTASIALERRDQLMNAAIFSVAEKAGIRDAFVELNESLEDTDEWVAVSSLDSFPLKNEASLVKRNIDMVYPPLVRALDKIVEYCEKFNDAQDAQK